MFENVNTGGVALTVFELITATFAAEDFELRVDWDKRKETLNKYSVIVDVAATDFLTSMSLLVGYNRWKKGGAAISCKKKDVIDLLLSEYRENVDLLMAGFIEAAKFLQEQRIFSNSDLPYSTQLIPLAAALILLGGAIQ